MPKLDVVKTDERAEEIYKYVKDIMGLKPSLAIAALAATLGFMAARSEHDGPIEAGFKLIVDFMIESYEKDLHEQKKKLN